MRSIPTIVAVISASLAFVSCSKDSRDDEPSRYGRTYSEIPQYTPPPPPEVTPEPTVDAFTPPPTPPPTVIPQNAPYASPVAGKPGFVISPHAPYSGYVDVRGFSPGMEVKCPYTQKVFLVP